MAEIKALNAIELRCAKPLRGVRAILSGAARGEMRVLENTDEVYAAAADGVFYGISADLCAVKKYIEACEYDTVLAFCSKSDGGAPAAAAYAYLGGMPPLPRGDVDIKRLAPTLAEVVADGAGIDLSTADKIMRGGGVFGAIADGRLVGFVGLGVAGGIEIFRVLDASRTREIGTELVKFSASFAMTGGYTPFAVAKSGDTAWRHMLSDCGFTECELFAYTV